MWPISARTLSFRLQTFRKFCSHSNIPIRYLWTAFFVPLSFIFFYEKQYFRMVIVTLRHSRCFENGNDDFGVEAFWATLRTLVKWFHGSKRFMQFHGFLVSDPRSIVLCLSFASFFLRKTGNSPQAIPRNRCVVLALLSRWSLNGTTGRLVNR